MKVIFKENNMKKQFIIGIVLLISGIIQAQQPEQYIFINAGGGFHNLSYTLQNGSEKGQAGYTLNAGYSYFFNPHWGLMTGIGIQSFHALSTLNYSSSTPDVDADGESYLFRSKYTNWQENQHALFFDIPLSLQYRCPVSNKLGLLASLGAMISMPVSAAYKTSGGQIVTTGYYSQYIAELKNLPQHGFSTFTGSYKGDMTLKTAWLGVADLGGLIRLNSKTDLYIGGYLNYGLNNSLKSDSKLMFQSNGKYNGVFASNQTSQVNPMSVGVKVGLYWRLGEARQIIKQEEFVVLKQPVDTIQRIVAEKTEPVKAADSVVIARKTEIPKVVVVEQPVLKVVEVRDTVKPEDPFEKAKRIAATISVSFGMKSDQTGNSENDKINALSEILNANPDICLRIVGHTCNTGTHEINMKYGMKRAVSMKQKFLTQKVADSQLTTESKAYDQPLVPNTSNENKAKNRRVEIKVFRQNKL